ncbi:S49 family peptidase [Marinobacter sp. X15-166B]|uniref:S49 family peptidase n=1 Tax=Marinobacter sp. X15-166B TaxID=1897620 RepID=UPI00085C6237|nr:S49 family peptidase [Marinobacter sp. X15-166B]OEY68041.1 peptidase S49 [Marinobacter sp. X15-166B]
MSEWEPQGKAGWGTPAKGVSKEAGHERDWKLIEKLVLSVQAEQRKSRRWGIFFKLMGFAYLFVLLYLFVLPTLDSFGTVVGDHTAVVEVSGEISAEEYASADSIVGALREAFAEPAAKAVVLRINSPGGSPVQAGYVYDEIVRLRAEYPDKKVYAVIADIGASGAYYIAAAADEIYADKASLVGSIGVVGGGFGFTGALDKLGIERRLYTAGENKGFLDPFSPERADEVAFWEQVLATTHQQFIDQVRKGRGDRLAEDERVFSGLIWTGEQALELGLVDGLGSTSYVARNIVGQENLIDYSRGVSPFRELIDRLGVSVGAGIARSVFQSRLELR